MTKDEVVYNNNATKPRTGKGINPTLQNGSSKNGSPKAEKRPSNENNPRIQNITTFPKEGVYLDLNVKPDDGSADMADTLAGTDETYAIINDACVSPQQRSLPTSRYGTPAKHSTQHPPVNNEDSAYSALQTVNRQSNTYDSLDNPTIAQINNTHTAVKYIQPKDKKQKNHDEPINRQYGDPH